MHGSVRRSTAIVYSSAELHYRFCIDVTIRSYVDVRVTKHGWELVRVLFLVAGYSTL